VKRREGNQTREERCMRKGGMKMLLRIGEK